MTGLLNRTRRVGIALALAASLTVSSIVASMLLGDQLANVLPGPDVVLADESEGHGG